jgi:putative ABC transport system permease protein
METRSVAVPADRIAWSVVTPGYFETIGTPILRGRAFDDRDRSGSPFVAVVNDTLAKAWWPAGDALGQRIVAPREEGGGRTFEVVGIVKPGKYEAVNEAPAKFIWFPYAQAHRPSMTVVAHVNGNDAGVVAAARQALREIDPVVSLTNVTTFDALVRARGDDGLRAAAIFVAAISLAGLLRALFGVYGLLSYFAHLQTREIGIRLAFGASHAAIIWTALRRGAMIVFRGAGVGLVLAALGVRVFGKLVSHASVPPVTWAVIPLFLMAVALVAAYVPIRRVLTSGPLNALRQD